MKTVLSGICFAALVLASPAALADSNISTLSLQGTGSVSAEPDMASITTGVVTNADTARDALTANTKAMSALLDLVKATGVASKDMQTSGFSVQPQYQYAEKPDANGYRQPPRIAGYEVRNALTVRLRDLDNLGAVLDQMVSAGSNTIDGINFAVSDSSALLDEARRAAMKDAMHKAELYADTAGVCLDGITSIAENGGYAPQPKLMRAMVAEDAMSSPVPVASGEVGYDMTVSVNWEISQGPCD